MVGRLVSFWDGLFSGAMLVLGRVLVCESQMEWYEMGNGYPEKLKFSSKNKTAGP